MLTPADHVAAPENALLRWCGRRGVADSRPLAQLLDGPLDWWLVLRQAQRHGLLALLYDCLVGRGLVDRVPPEPRQALATSARIVAARSLLLTGELLRMVRAMGEEGVPVLPFKGPVVAVAAYGDLALRSFGDLDILTPEESLPAARRVLASLGYRPALALAAGQEQAYLQSECALQFHNPERGHVVELHWRFSERNASVDLPPAEIWSRAGRVDLAGSSVTTLCPEDLVLYLCVHGAKHQWERFEWVCCLAELIRSHPAADWNIILEQARRHRILRILRLGLCLTQSLCDVNLPEPVARLGSDRVAQAVARRVADLSFAPPQGAPHYQERAARYLFMMRVRENWKDRSRILFHSAFKPPHPDADEWIHLPPRLAFLYHLFRPVRLIGQYGAVAWRYYLR